MFNTKWHQPERYIVKSPGKPVRFLNDDGEVVKINYMNRAERRKLQRGK